ncbi:LANO_0G11122g1_1 [Lachancea nothofagi CBS 11611]|uniref:LANO_0G11122g1_1 n=1 Tax=Lachancea nothofagi CBS 11611 TaxID=1266666 RepID=A0A1G4KJC3_9SACH|nr:LANO_0G11122g1_1 [Lachancea nothofagi CBS 11611]
MGFETSQTSKGHQAKHARQSTPGKAHRVLRHQVLHDPSPCYNIDLPATSQSPCHNRRFLFLLRQPLPIVSSLLFSSLANLANLAALPPRDPAQCKKRNSLVLFAAFSLAQVTPHKKRPQRKRSAPAPQRLVVAVVAPAVALVWRNTLARIVGCVSGVRI